MYSKGNVDFVNIVSEHMDEGEIRSAVLLASISAQITKCRLERGMSQKEFAQFLNVSQGMVSKWESSHYNFSIETLSKICSRLNLTLNIDIEDERGNTSI